MSLPQPLDTRDARARTGGWRRMLDGTCWRCGDDGEPSRGRVASEAGDGERVAGCACPPPVSQRCFRRCSWPCKRSSSTCTEAVLTTVAALACAGWAR